MLPEKLCHTENMAPGTAAMGNKAKWVAASEVARPEFCIPTSMAMAERLDGSLPVMAERPYPKISPNTLCRITAIATIRLHVRMLVALCATMMPMMKAMDKVEIIGSNGTIRRVVRWK